MSYTPLSGKGGRSEFGVALLLLGLGGWAIVDASRLTDLASRGPVSAQTLPIVIGALLIAMAVLLTIDLIRGGRGEQESARTSTSPRAATGKPSACS